MEDINSKWATQKNLLRRQNLTWTLKKMSKCIRWILKQKAIPRNYRSLTKNLWVTKCRRGWQEGEKYCFGVKREHSENLRTLGVVNLSGHGLLLPETIFKVKRKMSYCRFIEAKQSLFILIMWGAEFPKARLTWLRPLVGGLIWK